MTVPFGKLTGIHFKVIEVSTAEMSTKIKQEYKAGTGAMMRST